MDPKEINVSNRSSYLSDFFEGAVAGDFSEKNSRAKVIGQVGAGLIPIYGQAADARDTGAAIRKVWRGESGGWASLGFAIVGWIPGLGDLIKSSSKIKEKEEIVNLARAVTIVEKGHKLGILEFESPAEDLVKKAEYSLTSGL